MAPAPKHDSCLLLSTSNPASKVALHTHLYFQSRFGASQRPCFPTQLSAACAPCDVSFSRSAHFDARRSGVDYIALKRQHQVKGAALPKGDAGMCLPDFTKQAHMQAVHKPVHCPSGSLAQCGGLVLFIHDVYDEGQQVRRLDTVQVQSTREQPLLA